MKLITAEEFVRGDYFAGKPPLANTIRKGVRSGDVPGMVCGRLCYVDVDAIAANLTAPKTQERMPPPSRYRV
ncbi:MAG TPA: hypothetical protein VFM56_12665 [Solimonas sp.]|nr:hypothetical protein [Solimonas sp.]